MQFKYLLYKKYILYIYILTDCKFGEKIGSGCSYLKETIDYILSLKSIEFVSIYI